MTAREKTELRTIAGFILRNPLNKFWRNRLTGIVRREFSRAGNALTAWTDRNAAVLFQLVYLLGLAIGVYIGKMLFG